MIRFEIASKMNLGRVRQTMERKQQRAVERALFRLEEESLQQVPRDTGALAESCEVIVNGKEGAVGYGTEYAVIQHERTDFAHPNGGNAKYLENPMNDSLVRKGMLQDMAEALKL